MDNFIQERGSMMGVSIPYLNQWMEQLHKTNDKPSQPIGCILKLYDHDLSAGIKLCDSYCFVGILEFKNLPKSEQEKSEENEQQMSGVPNEDQMPVLHVILKKKMQILDNAPLQTYLGL